MLAEHARSYARTHMPARRALIDLPTSRPSYVPTTHCATISAPHHCISPPHVACFSLCMRRTAYIAQRASYSMYACICGQKRPTIIQKSPTVTQNRPTCLPYLHSISTHMHMWAKEAYYYSKEACCHSKKACFHSKEAYLST